MTAILKSLVTVLGAWLVVSPYLLGTRGVALAIAIAAGAIALVLSIVAIKQEAYKPTLKPAPRPAIQPTMPHSASAIPRAQST